MRLEEKNQEIKKIDNLSLLLLLIVAVFFYLKTIHFDFVYDDIGLFLKNNYYKEPFGSIFKAFIPGYISAAIYNPIPAAFFFCIFKLVGALPSVFHGINIFLFLAITALLYKILAQLLKNRIVAWFAVLLYVMHPTHAECVCWFSGNGYLFATLFSLISFEFFLKGIKKSGYDLKNFSISFIFFVMGILSQPATITLPIIFLAYTLFFCKKQIKSALSFCLYSLIPIFVYCSFTITISMMRFNTGASIMSFGTKLMVYAKYIFNAFFAKDYMPIYPYGAGFSIASKWLFPSILLIVGVIAVILFSKDRILRFSLLALMLSILQYSHLIIETAFKYADRYLFFATIFSSLLIPYIIFKVVHKQALAVLLLLPFIIYFGIALNDYTQCWENGDTLWSYSYQKNPTAKIVIYNLGQQYFEKEDFKNALPFNLKALENNPLKLDLYMMLLRDRFELGQYQKGAELIPKIKALLKCKAESTNPYSSMYKYMAINAYMAGDINSMPELFFQGIEEDKNYPNELIHAVKLQKDGKYSEAIAIYQVFLKSGVYAPDIEKLLFASIESQRDQHDMTKLREKILKLNGLMLERHKAIENRDSKQFDKLMTEIQNIDREYSEKLYPNSI